MLAAPLAAYPFIPPEADVENLIFFSFPLVFTPQEGANGLPSHPLTPTPHSAHDSLDRFPIAGRMTGLR